MAAMIGSLVMVSAVSLGYVTWRSRNTHRTIPLVPILISIGSALIALAILSQM